MNIHLGSESCTRSFPCQHVFKSAASSASPGFLLSCLTVAPGIAEAAPKTAEASQGTCSNAGCSL